MKIATTPRCVRVSGRACGTSLAPLGPQAYASVLTVLLGGEEAFSYERGAPVMPLCARLGVCGGAVIENLHTPGIGRAWQSGYRPSQIHPRRGCIQGYFAHKKLPLLWDFRRALGKDLL